MDVAMVVVGVVTRTVFGLCLAIFAIAFGLKSTRGPSGALSS